MHDKGIDVKISQGPQIPVKDLKTCPCIMVLFGITGDLSQKKLLPALFNLEKDKTLPEHFTLIGTGRKPHTRESFLETIYNAVQTAPQNEPLDQQTWLNFAKRIEYLQSDFNDRASFSNLRRRIDEITNNPSEKVGELFFLATPPSTFPKILDGLNDAGLLQYATNLDSEPWPRVIIEKPFGHDLASAKQLNLQAAQMLSEKQIYRVDHFLAKETIQNIIVFRFANSIFEPLWNNKYIDHIQITAAEDIGIGNRGAFYEETGVVRDVFQNHLLQILALVTMEPPTSFDAKEIRNEKTKVFKSLVPLTEENIPGSVVLGQYQGYLEEPDVPAQSKTPTYAAFQVFIDNWRWKGVPFYVRAGKRLSRRLTEVVVQFKSAPTCLFGGEVICNEMTPNRLCMRIQPDAGISLDFIGKIPGDVLQLGGVSMDFSYARGFDKKPREAYERLLLDCMRGDQTLFARRDGVELEWQYVMPIIQAWEAGKSGPLQIYEPGSDGPGAALDLMGAEKRKWKPLY